MQEGTGFLRKFVIRKRLLFFLFGITCIFTRIFSRETVEVSFDEPQWQPDRFFILLAHSPLILLVCLRVLRLSNVVLPLLSLFGLRFREEGFISLIVRGDDLENVLILVHFLFFALR